MSNRATDLPDLTPAGPIPAIKSIFDFSDEALGQLRLWLEMHPPAIPYGQILGVPQNLAQSDFVATQEARTVTTFGDLPTVGPQLDMLPDGQYLILFGCACFSNVAGVLAEMGVSANGAAVDTNHLAIGGGTELQSPSHAIVQTLQNAGNNTVVTKYASLSATSQFARRWLVALRQANP